MKRSTLSAQPTCGAPTAVATIANANIQLRIVAPFVDRRSANRRPMFSKISLDAQRQRPSYPTVMPAGSTEATRQPVSTELSFCDAAFACYRSNRQNRSREKATLGRKTNDTGAYAKGMRFMEAVYLGVAAMGQPMANKLLDAGHSLTIYDINEAAMRPLLERQARRANSPRELADRCEIVFVSLPTLAAFREVAFGAEGLASGKAMKLLVNTCTVGVPFVKEIERAMAARAS